MTAKRKKLSKANKGYGHEIPPQEKHVFIYFCQKGVSKSAARDFFLYFSQLKWKSKYGVLIKNWKALANEWIWKNFKI